MHIPKQNGMTMWGMAMVLGLIAFFTLLGLNLIPPYLQNFKVRTALQNIAKQSDTSAMSREEIVTAVQKRLEIDSIDDMIDVNKHLKIESRGKMKIIRIAYEVRVPLAYNITALLDFNEHVETRSNE